MIPPPRHASARLSPLHLDSVRVGSYNSNFIPATSPTATFSDDVAWVGRGGRVGAASNSFPEGGLDMPAASTFPASGLTTVSVVNLPSEKAGVTAEVQNNRPIHSKPLKGKNTKAERHALQEVQQAAKAEGGKAPPAASGAVSSANAKSAKAAKPPSQKNDNVTVAPSEKKGMEKAKKCAVVKQNEARNIVGLFRHLPQYEHGTQLPDLELKFFQLDPMHPAVYKVGLQYLSGDVCGGNARCIAMLLVFRELPLTLSKSEAKAILHSDIDCFINEKIMLADKVIFKHAVTKIRDGDVLLTFGSSSAIEMVLLYAHELLKQFRAVVLDSCPELERQLLLCRLVGKGISLFLGASSVLSNGTVCSRVGTACVAMVAHAFRVPVLVCYYVSMIITDYGMVPPTSMPVIVGEYWREQL
ncbi:hypothetical protein P3X46_016261 [Hevea brasiliensis]|uniref:Translation initiation factor eIF2B subunit delta n=1 Tax=Hevea brasiliensis TaxID=3981 RepID=A0ABQ9LYL1_HEVBR|nr:hypothetical protein P3X46_016261 [Hevea brasiliensis]